MRWIERRPWRGISRLLMLRLSPMGEAVKILSLGLISCQNTRDLIDMMSVDEACVLGYATGIS